MDRGEITPWVVPTYRARKPGTSQSRQVFAASRPWSPARPETLVVCCSDGRWRAQIEEYIGDQVSSQADIYAVPGGAAVFDFLRSSVFEACGLESAFKFLAVHHQLRSVWLIAHDNCAYYAAARGFNDHLQPCEKQFEDLRTARRQIEVHSVYATLEGQDRVVFVPVEDDERL